MKKIFSSWVSQARLAIAIIIDAIDFLLSPIPILNSVWDFVTFGYLYLVLKDKRLAYFSLGELIIPGIGAIGFLDGFIPSATIILSIDMIKRKFADKPKGDGGVQNDQTEPNSEERENIKIVN